MDDQRLGVALRAIRIKKRLRQSDVARLAGVRRDHVIDIELGRLDRIEWRTVRAVAAAVGAVAEVDLRWQGAGLDRLMSEGHARMHELLGRFLRSLAGWDHAAEVSFSIHGERGVIDILAWHAASRSLLIIELKTSLGDPQELIGVLDRRVRLARRIASDRGWEPATVSAWVVFADTRTNRRHVNAHHELLRGRLPSDGHTIRRWLDQPSGTILALSFWTDVAAGDRTGRIATPKRIRPTKSERGDPARPPTSGQPSERSDTSQHHGGMGPTVATSGHGTDRAAP